MMQRFILMLVAVAVVGAVSGCRSYGGYGSEEAIFRQINNANEEFADQIESVRSQQEAIVSAATAMPQGEQIQSDLELMIQTHEILLERHRARAEALSESSSHRDLRRAYLAIISDKETFRDMVLRLQWYVADGNASSAGPDLPYHIVPVYYEQVAGLGGSAMRPRSPQTPGDRDLSETVQQDEQGSEAEVRTTDDGDTPPDEDSEADQDL